MWKGLLVSLAIVSCWARMEDLKLYTTDNPYRVSSVINSENGFKATLSYTGPLIKDSVQNLLLEVFYLNDYSLRVRLTDQNNARWEVPDIIQKTETEAFNRQYKVELNYDKFGIKVTRVANGEVLFQVKPDSDFQYNDRDIIWPLEFNEETYLYGLGERVSNFRLKPGVYTLFAKDASGPFDDGKFPGDSLYSSQPFYLALKKSGYASGGFLLNSNAMDAYVDVTSLKYRTIGGVIDFFLFTGPEPEDVVRQYQALIGKPVLVPYWSFGWHHCRWGYKDLDALEAVVRNYTERGLPLDVMWTDIDYMQDYLDFTVDDSRYPPEKLKAFIDKLHANDQKFIPIVDAGVAMTDYFGYNEGLKRNVFISSPNHPGPFIGKVWPGLAVFVDWFNPNATQYWHDMLDIFHSNMEFDGLWNDMNEAANFCTGECGYAPVDLNLPYTPGGEDLNSRTIDLSSTHYNNISEYDVHNMYGFLMAKASASYIVERMHKRPVVISRSSFPGHGKYASRWLGDNGSTWDWMRWSIGSTFSFQMFGIPLIGSDICGFNYNTTAELCTRWYQLGTLYPFARTHNSIEAIDQEPWSFGDQLLRVANKSIRLRYSLIHFIYSEVFKLSLTGGTYFKPTFFNYPKDTLLWETYAEDNFMLSDKLIVHPVLESGVDHRLAYFPDDLWYNFYTGASLQLPENRVVDLSADIEDPVNIHIRGGSIIPLADHADTAKTIEQLRNTPLTLLIALDKHGQAHGDLVVDDGISPDTLEKSAFNLLRFEHSQASNSHSKLRIVPSGDYTPKKGEYESISRIVVYGCNKAPAGSSAGGKVYKYSETCLFEMNGVRLDGETVIDLFYKD